MLTPKATSPAPTQSSSSASPYDFPVEGPRACRAGHRPFEPAPRLAGDGGGLVHGKVAGAGDRADRDPRPPCCLGRARIRSTKCLRCGMGGAGRKKGARNRRRVPLQLGQIVGYLPAAEHDAGALCRRPPGFPMAGSTRPRDGRAETGAHRKSCPCTRPRRACVITRMRVSRAGKKRRKGTEPARDWSALSGATAAPVARRKARGRQREPGGR